MPRLAVLLALIFAFGALAGVSTAHAHRFVSAPIVVLNHVDAQNQAIPVVVKVQRGEIDLGSGIVMPCGPYHAVQVSGPMLPPAPPASACAPISETISISWPQEAPRRPPRAV